MLEDYILDISSSYETFSGYLNDATDKHVELIEDISEGYDKSEGLF